MMEMPMAEVEQILERFRTDFEAGREPNVADFLGEADPGDRQVLAERIDRYLMNAPRRAWDPVAYEQSREKVVVDRFVAKLETGSGRWKELLPELRNEAQVKRSTLVERLAAALGVGTGEAQLEKVGDYYNQMEHGNLPARGVSSRVIEALASIVGVDAEEIRDAGGYGRSGPSSSAAAFARVVDPDERYTLEQRVEGGGEVDAQVSPGERDEIDELFTGG